MRRNWWLTEHCCRTKEEFEDSNEEEKIGSKSGKGIVSVFYYYYY